MFNPALKEFIMIEIHNLSKQFGKLRVLNHLDLSLSTGKITAILGPNGSGKTTLIKSILGLVRPDSGEILFDGSSIRHRDRYRNKIGYLSQIARFQVAPDQELT
jgi:Cu-processing system ATP-binding protein